MKVYTKTGDTGKTSLVGGTRISKNDPRLEAYGSVDEALAQIAYLRDNIATTSPALILLREELLQISRDLMSLSSILACEPEICGKMPPIELSHIHFLEEAIDRIQITLPTIDKFTVPGGHPVVSLAHVARTVTRRAERRVLQLHEIDPLPATLLTYLNRLSDYLYVVGRKLTVEYKIKEILWIPAKH